MKTLSFLAATVVSVALVGIWAHAQTAPEQPTPERNLPYKAVHNPEFIRAADATFLHPEDRVIGVLSGKVAKAYPAGILSQHGLVEDESPSGPIAITW
jgi:hypothetical protein